MQVTNRLARASTLLKAGAALIALMPGVATLLGLVSIPPSIGTLIKFVSFFVGTSSLLVIILLEARIARAKPMTIVWLVIGLAVVGSSAATGYYVFASGHILVVNDKDFSSNIILIPLRPSKEISNIVSYYDGDYLDALESSPMRFKLMDLLQDESGGALSVLAILLVVAQAFSITAVVLAAWKASS